MLEAYARWLTRRPVAWTVFVATILLALVTGWLSVGVPQDDDVLAFLPRTDPDIAAFYEINEAFGATDVCLVGLAAPDVFDPAFLGPLQELTRAIKDTAGVENVLSITNVSDFEKDEDGGIRTATLVGSLPQSDADRAALRAKVLSRDHIVGNLVNPAGDAVMLYAWAAPGSEPREVAGRVRAAVEAQFPTTARYYGGGPFIADFIFSATQQDMQRLTPWAVLVILVIVLAAFRDLAGTALGLFATLVGITTSRALMVLSGAEVNLVLSSMPVILFAAGSAYAIHMLSKYYHHAERLGPGTEAVVAAVVGTSGNVLAAGLTTMAGMWSFLLMDIAPMRTFGLYTGIGIFVALLMSISFVPAVLALWPRPARSALGVGVRDATAYFAVVTRDARSLSIGAMVVFAVIGALFAGRVDTRMELSAFFDDDSAPAKSDAFLTRSFGGAQFLQVRVQGDLADPLVLQQVGRLADRLRVMPHIAGVQGVHEAMELIHDAFSGTRRVPDNAGQAKVLYRFLSSDPSVARLVTDDRSQALLIAKVGTGRADDVDAMLAAVEALFRDEAATSLRGVDPATPEGKDALAAVFGARIAALGVQHGFAVPDDLEAQVRAWLDAEAPSAAKDVVTDALVAFLGGPECFVSLAPAEAAAVAAAAAGLGPDAAGDALSAAIAAALRPEDAAADAAADGRVGDLAFSLEAPLADAWRDARGHAAADALIKALKLALPGGDVGARVRGQLADKLQERESPGVGVPGDGTAVAWTVSGQPVVYRGLSRAVTASQLKSLGSSLLVVFIILSVLLRSPLSGLLASAPTILTVLVVYGTMGALGVHLDIGTSMIASIIVGAGVDYAVHLLAAWHAEDDEPISAAVRRAVDDTAHAIWTNALMVAAGFYVLTLGEARPLRNVGGLTAAAMIVAAVATFTVIPILAGRRRYNADRTVESR